MRISSGGVEIGLGARHVRTVMGMGLMLFSVGFVVLDKILAVRIKVALPCPASVIEVVHVWIFPVLLFFGGLALFSREAFSDLLGGAKALVGRRPPP